MKMDAGSDPGWSRNRVELRRKLCENVQSREQTKWAIHDLTAKSSYSGGTNFGDPQIEEMQKAHLKYCRSVAISRRIWVRLAWYKILEFCNSHPIHCYLEVKLSSKLNLLQIVFPCQSPHDFSLHNLQHIQRSIPIYKKHNLRFKIWRWQLAHGLFNCRESFQCQS